MSYVVSTEVVNPFGLCLGEGWGGEDYAPFAEYKLGYNFTFDGSEDRRVWYERLYESGFYFNYHYGENDGISIDLTGRPAPAYSLRVDVGSLIEDYVRRVYNLPDDTFITTYVTFEWARRHQYRAYAPTKTFETEEEAVEYIDNYYGTVAEVILFDTIGSNENNISLFGAAWRQEVDGVWINREVKLNYTGGLSRLRTINDFVNFLALFFNVTPEEVTVTRQVYSSSIRQHLIDNPPAFDCDPYYKATIVNLNDPVSPIQIDVPFSGFRIPSDVTVTVVDGDPPVTLTEVVNGDGSVVISDNGNINMSNDGGTFFLNEFGNVGFYANGDASLTADNQVQLGVGQNSVTVENGSLTIRDETGSATLTAEDINRLKETLM